MLYTHEFFSTNLLRVEVATGSERKLLYKNVLKRVVNSPKTFTDEKKYF